jgi:ribosomal protein S21
MGSSGQSRFEALLLRFRRGVEASGILREYRRRRRFIPNHERRRNRAA